MSLPELATPIRIYWDMTPLPALPPDHGKIAADIIALKVLSLDICATGQSIPASTFSIIKSCIDARIGVTLAVSPGGFDREAIDALLAAPPRELLLEIASPGELAALVPLHPAVSGISFPLCSANWQGIPEIIRLCADKGIKSLVFPMQRLYGGGAPFHIPAHGLAAIAESLLAFTPPPDMRITAHDPFVWRAVFPRIPFPNGRCQAANTMLSIDPQGVVYPCPVMPIPLGDLRSDSLKEIAKGSAKKELRAKLLRLPGDCVDCTVAGSCKGGCRGRAERVSGSWDGIDPGCRRQKES